MFVFQGTAWFIDMATVFADIAFLVMAISLFKRRNHAVWDQVGEMVSFVCFIHCAITPVLVLALPWLGNYFEDPLFHIFIFVLVVPIGLYAFWHGYKHHHQKLILYLGLPGLFIVGVGAFVADVVPTKYGHEIITIVGSLLLISAHALNRRRCRTLGHGHGARHG